MAGELCLQEVCVEYLCGGVKPTETARNYANNVKRLDGVKDSSTILRV